MSKEKEAVHTSEPIYICERCNRETEPGEVCDSCRSSEWERERWMCKVCEHISIDEKESHEHEDENK